MLFVIGVLLLILKLAGVITWAWYIVLLPWYIVILLIVLVCTGTVAAGSILAIFIGFLHALFGRKRQ